MNAVSPIVEAESFMAGWERRTRDAVRAATQRGDYATLFGMLKGSVQADAGQAAWIIDEHNRVRGEQSA